MIFKGFFFCGSLYKPVRAYSVCKYKVTSVSYGYLGQVAVLLKTVCRYEAAEKHIYFGWYGRLYLCRYKFISMLYGSLVI